MTKHHDDKKAAKKWFTLKRNKRDLMMLRLQQDVSREQERIEDLKETQAPARDEEKQEEQLWSARTQEIRNKLNNKKREADNRWNNFAGTSDAGSRGR